MKNRLSLAFLSAALLAGSAFAQSSSEWIDVTAPLDPATTPVYQGDAPIEFKWLHSMEKGEGFNLSSYTMGAHSGTHLDAPLHFVKGAASIDKIPLSTLIGPARIIDCSPNATKIDAAELNKHQWRGAERILFRTANSRKGWMVDPTFHKDFVYLAPDAAKLLADAGVKLVGVDYLSAEQFGGPAPDTHRTLLGKGIPIIEGLDLRNASAGNYDLILLPLRTMGREGAPARAAIRKR